MALCHQCDSKVAENIAFCPYCGLKQEQNEPADTGSDIYSRENAESSQPENKSDESALIKERQADTGEDIEKAKYENFVIERETIKNESENNAGEDSIFVPSESEKADPFQSQTESELMSYEETEVKEYASGKDAVQNPIEESTEETNSAFADNSPDIAESNLSETRTSEASDFPSAENSDFEQARFNEDDENTIEIHSPLIVRASENSIERPISKPEVELEQADANCPPPKFDSVRIMEKPASRDKAIGENARNIKSVGSLIKDSPLETQIAHSPQKKQADAGGSYTAPNIAVTETDGKKSAKLKPLEEGTVLNGRYEIVRKIGGGGMGAVYLASDKNLGGVLRAVKEMVQSYIEDAQQEKAVNDFKRESLLLTSLEHQSIPTIYDYFFDEKEARFYLVMKYISGGDLSSRLRSAPENRIEEKIVTEWAIQIADVLDYLHNRQPAIIYRDLKPANIMIDGNTNRVMLIDFGIARWVNKEEKGVTAVGTMGYAPPELFSGNVEPRSDIYSLGSTLFHLLTGADPQSNPLLIFDFQKHPRPRQINPQISDQMEKILMRAVEYSADKRFASAAELRVALATHFENLKANKVSFGVKESPSPAAFADQPVFCGFCGQKIVATDMFCAFCGAKQPLAQKGVQLQSYSPTRFTAQLLIVGTNDLEAPSFQLEKDENLVGRRDPMSNIFPEIDLSKFDPQTKISRKHARIWREGVNFLVEDLGSSNGTIILSQVKENVRLLPHQPFTLNNGDKIKLGDTTLHFVVA
jgi:serine/threonine-protein kinase